ncbi:unnamed protein product [Ilex paraguariensis]|uniref:Exopolyphosphatase n=1 Tax=Ilex paraguariensis TaxID=185542 RepID=A0ABC8R4F5_9AQUA
MASNLPAPRTTASPAHLFAAVDMGTNSFKLLIVRADPSTGRFLTLDRLKEPVLLGRDTPSATISSASQLRAIDTLCKFQRVLQSHHIPPSHSHFVATSAVREASNQLEFIGAIHQTLGFEIDVLSGLEEARLIYMGVLQFHPVYSKTVLTIDIGGGSTEFVIGKEGKVLFGSSVKLGHVTLTQNFVNNNGFEKMREHIQCVIQASGLIEKVKEYGIEVVIGSSGTVRALEKAIFFGYARDLGDNVGDCETYRREWKFSSAELGILVEKLCGEEGVAGGRVRRERFFKRRSEFIVAGAVLLKEIFGMLGIEEMEVSGCALGEGVISEKLAEFYGGHDLNTNARWRSVVRLATRFNDKIRMKSALVCAGIAKEIFEGLRKWNEVANDQCKFVVTMDEKDLEYLEAACLLHNIGLFTGKKGYQKQSYCIIMNGDHLHGYGDKEVKLVFS